MVSLTTIVPQPVLESSVWSDTATHFFFDALPKGTYVFEYSTRIVHKGRYQTGFALIECMYAPEFNSHSESIWVEAE